MYVILLEVKSEHFGLPGVWPTIPWPLCLRTTAPPSRAGAAAFAGSKRTPNHPANHLPENQRRD